MTVLEKKKILLGMSGGIDSTYAALRLIEEGHEVEGAVLIMHGLTEIDSARRAAEKLGIPLREIDCTSEFEKRVVEYFIDEYTQGRTPNPCIVCNPEVKFKYLYEHAMEGGFDLIATGHYAKIVESPLAPGRLAVRMGKDSKKDQSYMLYRLPQYILERLVFPLAEEEKVTVKNASDKKGISEPGQKESQEICFIGDGNYREYIESCRGVAPEGNFVDPEGNILGRHKGILHYTVGQRKGLGISLGERVFVTAINPETREITLSSEGSSVKTLFVSDTVYSGIDELAVGTTIRAEVKIRYQARPAAAFVTALEGGKIQVDFDEPQRFAAPGQSAVVYSDGIVLLGGFIR